MVPEKPAATAPMTPRSPGAPGDAAAAGARLRQIWRSPENCRAYAEFLMADNLPDRAFVFYRRAAEHYFQQGRLVKGLAVSLHCWRLRPPQPLEFDRLAAAFRQAAGQRPSRLLEFFARLDAAVLEALAGCMVPVEVPAGHVFITPGQVHENLYLNASGLIKDSVFVSVEEIQRCFRPPIVEIAENECFGEIYPFETQIPSHSYIEALGPAEVIRIHRSDLQRLCRRHPAFEAGLLQLLNIRAREGDRPPDSLRRAKRVKLGVPLELMIDSPSPQGQPLKVTGRTLDVSVGGICVVLDDNGDGAIGGARAAGLHGATVKVAAGLKCLKLFFSGRVAWSQFVRHEGRKALALGIRLSDLPPSCQGILLSFLNLMPATANGEGRTLSVQRPAA